MRSRRNPLLHLVRSGALALLFAAARPGSAAPPDPHAGHAGRLPVRSYGTRQGLTNLSILRLVQDADGFLWVATDDGVFRFDGLKFERFGMSNGLPSNILTTLAVGAGKDVWIGTLNGLARWDGVQLRPVRAESGLPEGRVNEIAVSGSTVFVALQAGLYAQAADGMFASVPGWRGGTPASVWAGPDGSLAVAVGGAVRTRDAAGSWKEWGAAAGIGGGERVDSVLRDGHGVLWARSASRLWAQKPGQERFTDLSARVSAAVETGTLALDRAGDPLVPTKDGLVRVQGDRWTLLGEREGLPIALLYCALQDREGSLWLGATGLHQILGRGLWRSFGRPEGLAGDVAWSTLRDRDGRLWVGTDQGLAEDRGDRWRMVPGTQGRSVRSLALDRQGALWFGGAPAVVLRRDRAGRLAQFDAGDGLRGAKVLRLIFDRTDELWVATDVGLFHARLPQGNERPRFEREALPGPGGDERIGYVMEDARGRLWAAGEAGLVVREVGGWRRFTRADGLRFERTTYLLERRGGELCLAYVEGGGVDCYRTDGRGLQPTRRLDASTGLAGSRVYLLGEDVRGRLWVGTGDGVSVFGPQGVEQFSEAQGLPNDDTAAMSFLAEADGDVWIGTSGGLGRFSGASYEKTAEPPHPVLEWARNDQNTFAAAFAGLTFLDPLRVEMETRLLPVEPEWRATQAHEVRYPRLGGGNYTFELRTRLPAGPWSQPASISFGILPAWWSRLWFRALLVLLGLAALAGFGSWLVRTRGAARARLERARADATFRALIEGIPELVLVHRDGRVVYANPRAAAILGAPGSAALVGRQFAEVIAPADRAKLAAAPRAPSSERPAQEEIRLVRADGRTAVAELTSLTLDFAGEPATLVVGSDVTERNQLQARLQLADRMASVGTLASGMAHEINNPLFYLTAHLDLLATEARQLADAGVEPAAQTLLELLRAAQDGAQRVRNIVRGMMVFASKGKDEALRALEPAQVVELAIGLAAHEIGDRARLSRDLQPVPRVLADESRLAQALVNLLVNAARSIDRGAPDRNEIRVSVRPAPEGRVLIEVKDSGAGIPADRLGRIFDPFYTTRSTGEGTGLGLSVCHGIVTSLGGDLSVESTAGKGSTFRIELPAVPDDLAATPRG